MHNTATGTFEVDLRPLPTAFGAPGSKLGRMSIDKRLSGDLEGTSRGEMLTGMTDITGSAGYVAIEQVDGRLQGRHGSFVLQHSGTMDRGAPQLSVTVVPDSGTGTLVGLAGNFYIDIVGGKHLYRFDYTLPDAPPP